MPPLPLKITKKHHRHLNNPFPSPPKSLPFIHGALSSNPATLPHHQVYPIGKDFSLTWSCGSGGCLSISHQSQPTRALWSTTPGEAFASAAVVRTEVEESRGSFAVKDGEVLAICKHQSVEEIRVLYRSDLDRRGREHDLLFDGFLQADPKVQSFEVFEGIQFPVCLITGWVFTKKKTGNLAHGNARVGGGRRFWHGRSRRPPITARYWVLLDQKNSSQIGFQVKFGDINRQPGIISPKKFRLSSSSLRWKLIPQRERRGWCFWRPRGFASIPSDDEGEPEKLRSLGFNRVFITYSSEEDERFYGFGEQFSHVEFKGKRVPILVQEQGIGRGDQPISFAANLVSYRAGGNWSTTYAPSPFYITSKIRSLYLEGYDYSVFDLTKQDKVQIQVYSQSAQGRILHGNSPVELIEQFTDTIGRPPKLPNWIISGAIIGMQGGTKDVRNVWQQLQNYDVPISAFWLQDWVGQRKTIIGSQLWWNWELDSTHYSEWPQLIEEFRSSNIKVMAYCNPCIALTDQKPNKNRNMFREAESIGILVKDKSGAPYMVPNTAFDVGMLDFTHPKASSWFKNILRDMVDSGIQGWMADFGEGLPLDGTLYSGEDPVSAHNRYPELWARVNKEFVDEWKLSLREKDGEDPDESLVFFMRAGFRNSPKWAMLFWEGDQMVSWQNHDGIKSSVVGLLSSGISGFAFNHSDIGGYCTINLPLFKYNRSEELLMRWMELNAFNIVFRTHEGNKPSSNCQFYSNNSTLSHFARFAKVYQAWRFYRIQLVEEAAQKGLPVCRHLFLHYPDDEHVHSLTYQQFLVGSEILVVPVLDKGKKEVKAYFPTGGGCSWQHIWTGRVFSKPSKISSPTELGFEEWVEAPIGYPAIFVKFGSLVGETFLKNLRDQKIM